MHKLSREKRHDFHNISTRNHIFVGRALRKKAEWSATFKAQQLRSLERLLPFTSTRSPHFSARCDQFVSLEKKNFKPQKPRRCRSFIQRFYDVWRRWSSLLDISDDWAWGDSERERSARNQNQKSIIYVNLIPMSQKKLSLKLFFYFLWPKTFFVWLIERQFFKLMWRTIKKIIIFSSICMNAVVVRLSRIIFQAQESERAIGDGEKMKFMIV